MRMKTDRDQKGAIATNNVVNLSDKRNKGRRRVLFLSGTACLILIMFLFAVGFLHDRQKPALPFELSTMYRQFFSSSLPISNVKRGPIPICSGGNRAGRRVSCLVDGDTGWEAGVKWRLLNVDAPELSSSQCQAERRMALRARQRLQVLMSNGYRIDWTGKTGSYGRALVRIALSDGRYAGDVLLAEGLAQPWPNQGNIWCDGTSRP